MFASIQRGFGFLGQAIDLAREAEKAVSQGQSAQAARLPAPLAAVLAH